MTRRNKNTDNTKGTTTRDVNAAMRAAMALKLRAQKLTYDEIAHQCGYADRGACHKAVQRELERVVVENVEELRREECMMLDTLHSEIWPLAIDKENKSRLFAADRLLTISEHRRKLMGLDKRSEDELAQQEYTKRIVLTHMVSEEVQPQ